MAINGILQSYANVGAYGNQAQSDNAQQNKTPPSGLQRRLESTNTELSVVGKVKLSLDDLQAKAQAIKNLSNPPTLSDFKVAVQGVVQSINSLSKTVSAASAAREANAAAASALNDVRASRALNEVRKTVEGPEQDGLAKLEKIGISRQQDGTFEVNQKQLEKSFQDNQQQTISTIREVASRVEVVASKQLSSNGNIGQKFNDLSRQASDLQTASDNVRARLEFQRTFQQQLASQLANVGGYTARNAVATYLTVASL